MEEVTEKNAITLAAEPVRTALARFAHALSTLPAEQVPQAHDLASAIEDAMEEIKETLKRRLLLELNVRGEQVTEKGTTRMEAGGYTVRAVPTRTGFDPKKVEAAIRQKKKDPVDYMTPVTTFKVSDYGMAALLAEEVFTKVDCEACRYDKSFRLEVKRGIGANND